jgi:DNA-binding IclR family transcriptional regulator
MEGDFVRLHAATEPNEASEACMGTVGKAIAILRVLGGSRSPIALAGLAKQTNLPKSTVHRLVRTLVAQQVVHRTEDGYELRQHLVTAPLTSHRDLDVRDHALRAMLALYELTHLLVQLMVLEGDRIRCVDQFDARVFRIRAGGGRGSVWSAGSTAAGRVLLAQRMPVQHPRQWRTGVAFDRGGTHPGWTTGAALVVGGDHQVAAVSVTGPPELVARNNVRAAMSALAESAMRRTVLARAS